MEALSRLLFVGGVLLMLLMVVFPEPAEARNIREYSNTLSSSAPSRASDHTFTFTVLEPIPAGATLTFDFPVSFDLSNKLRARNIEMLVNGAARSASSTPSAAVDGVSIVGGAGGQVAYTISNFGSIATDDEITLKMGSHTGTAFGGSTSFSTSTGTTTIPQDAPGIINPANLGTIGIPMEVTGAGATIDTEFVVAIVNRVGIGPADTTEDIPPFRFDPAPTSTVGGTTLSVEISLRTDEFAICRWSPTPGVSYSGMSNTFTDTGLVFHATVVSVNLGALNTFYVRCIDDEGNFNTDDFEIAFTVNDQPTGTPNAEGEVEGDGTGSGNDGTGAGEGGGASSGGTSGSGGGGGSTSGSGGGSSGGGGGGGSGDDSGNTAGGGFETVDGEYPSGDAEVVIRGYAFPGSEVFILVDGEVVDSTSANSSGEYDITLEEIARGAYTFGVYAVGDDDVRSSVFSTSFTVTGGRTSALSNINVMPSITVDPDPVTPGQTLTISGYAIPDAEVTVENERDGASISRQQFTTQSDGDGFWEIELDTDNFGRATYKVRARAVAGSISTNFSNYTFYGVGEEAVGDLSADLNVDGSVNLTDFSILLFWWESDGGDSNPPADINRDGRVNLTDFSILLFQWTG